MREGLAEVDGAGAAGDQLAPKSKLFEKNSLQDSKRIDSSNSMLGGGIGEAVPWGYLEPNPTAGADVGLNLPGWMTLFGLAHEITKWRQLLKSVCSD